MSIPRRAKRDSAPSRRGEDHFAPAGNASTIDVAPPLGGTALGQCVVRALHSISVPPFDGQPVTVGKRFTFE
jgi:hypothetical protein